MDTSWITQQEIQILGSRSIFPSLWNSSTKNPLKTVKNWVENNTRKKTIARLQVCICPRQKQTWSDTPKALWQHPLTRCHSSKEMRMRAKRHLSADRRTRPSSKTTCASLNSPTIHSLLRMGNLQSRRTSPALLKAVSATWISPRKVRSWLSIARLTSRTKT